MIADFLEQFHAPVLQLLGGASSQEKIGEMQADYLIQRGRRSLIFLSLEREDIQVIAQHRLRGVRQVCAQRGIAEPLVCTLPSTREQARPVLRKALATCAPPWGLCCYNDEVALAALAVLADEKIPIPHAAAVIPRARATREVVIFLVLMVVCSVLDWSSGGDGHLPG